MTAVVIRHDTCRVCGPTTPPLDQVLDLGAVCLSDFPTQADAPAPTVPLELMRCPACTLVQLHHTTPAAWLYHEYWYRSGINESMVVALGDIVRQARARVPVGVGDLVIDIGANDGTLLSWYARTGPTPIRLAFEPAVNLADQLRPHAEILVPDFFSAREVSAKAKIVTSIAMFYDLDDPNAFVADVASVLDPAGVWIIQLSYLPAMIAQTAFDNICHEHLEYYTLTSLQRLLARHDLVVGDVEENTVNGGSVRVYVRHRHAPVDLAGVQRVGHLLVRERTDGYLTPAPFADFAWRIETRRRQVLATIDYVHRAGGVVDVYGASTKGNTLLQVWGLDRTVIRQALERSPEKWGRFTVGTGIPIVSEAEGRKDPAALLLVPIWHFREAILRREQDYVAGGGTLLFPLPSVELVTRRS